MGSVFSFFPMHFLCPFMLVIIIIIIINLIEYKIMLFPLFYILYVGYRSKQSSLDDNNSNRISVADESLERCFMMLSVYLICYRYMYLC